MIAERVITPVLWDHGRVEITPRSSDIPSWQWVRWCQRASWVRRARPALAMSCDSARPWRPGAGRQRSRSEASADRCRSRSRPTACGTPAGGLVVEVVLIATMTSACSVGSVAPAGGPCEDTRSDHRDSAELDDRRVPRPRTSMDAHTIPSRPSVCAVVTIGGYGRTRRSPLGPPATPAATPMTRWTNPGRWPTPLNLQVNKCRPRTRGGPPVAHTGGLHVLVGRPRTRGVLPASI
jgi:hypothetical protein